MDRYVFVINPVSGGAEKDTLMEEIEAFTRKRSIHKEIYYTTGENDPEKISGIAGRFQPQVLVVSGGDGTINSMIPVILEHHLCLGIIPAGSANGLAREFGITMQNAFEVLQGDTSKLMDVVCLDDNRYMIHLADFGVNALWIKRYEEEKRRGFIGYAISALKELGSWDDPFEVTVRYDEKSISFKTTFLVIANARTYGTGFQVNPGGDIGDGQVELCILKELSAQLFVNQLIGEQQDTETNNFFDTLAVREAELLSNKKVDFQSDGEYLGKRDRLKLKVLPNKIRIMVPE